MSGVIRLNARRGLRLMENLIEDNSRVEIIPDKVKRGRNKELIDKRNECLLHRYYFYSKVLKLKYEDVITSLSAEFFISDRTTTDIAMSESDYLSELFKKKYTPKELEKKFRFLNWKFN